MCGITAISRADRSSIPDARSFLRAALVAIEPRGHHATGIAWGDRLGHPWYWKMEGAASDVALLAPLPVGIRVAIGHTRYATKGSPSVEHNNHPIVGDGIALVHNGRVDNDDALIDRAGWERVGEVDSEALVAALATPSAFDATHPSEVLAEIEGVAAVAWLDSDTPDVLHLARLAERPLTVGWTRRGDLVASSTPATLAATGRFAGVAIARTVVVPEGTYMAVERGEIVERRRFQVRRPTSPIPADVPRRPRRPVVVDGIDWANLVPRRGWA